MSQALSQWGSKGGQGSWWGGDRKDKFARSGQIWGWSEPRGAGGKHTQPTLRGPQKADLGTRSCSETLGCPLRAGLRKKPKGPRGQSDQRLQAGREEAGGARRRGLARALSHLMAWGFRKLGKRPRWHSLGLGQRRRRQRGTDGTFDWRDSNGESRTAKLMAAFPGRVKTRVDRCFLLPLLTSWASFQASLGLGVTN